MSETKSINKMDTKMEENEVELNEKMEENELRSNHSLSQVLSTELACRTNENDDKQQSHRFGMCPEILYSVWNICFGVFLLFTTAFMIPGNAPAVITQCFAVAFIFAGLLSFVIIFKAARSIFVVLTVFSFVTTILMALTIIGFVYSIEGQMPKPELMMTNKYLEFVLGGLLIAHLAINIFSFFVFLKRSCKSAVDLDNEYSQRSSRGHVAEHEERGSREVIVMDY